MSERILPKPGNHIGRRTGPIVVYDADSGALCAAIPYMLLGGDVAFSGKHTITLGSADGVEKTKTIENLQKVFEKIGLQWDKNPFTLRDVPLLPDGKPEFNLDDCYIDDTYIPTGATEPSLQFKVQWLNPLGGGFMPSQTEDEFQALKNKWLGAGKFGGQKATAPAQTNAPAAPAMTPAAPAEAPKQRKTPTRQPAASAAPKAPRTSSALDVMNAICKKYGQGDQTSDEVQDQLANQYYWPPQDKLFGPGNQATTPEDWGKVMDELGL